MTTPVSFELANLLEKRDYPFEFVTIDGKNIPLNIPTIAEVVMWLYEKHRIWIAPNHQGGVFFWRYGSHQTQDFNSPTEAYKAAIEYTLKNLI